MFTKYFKEKIKVFLTDDVNKTPYRNELILKLSGGWTN